MAQVEAPVFRLLFEPKGVPGPGDATASTTTERSNLSQVQFRFETEGGTFVLHTSRLEMPDPWAERPIQFFPELVCVNLPHVLIRIRSTDSRRFPTLFYVYRFRFQNGASASDTVINLPKVAREICASPSFGLVYDSSDYDTYVVANLQREYNESTRQVEVFLHRWWRSGSSWQSKLNERVTLPPLPPGINFNMGKWLCDQVITFKETLLWVDLSQGVILLCKNPLQKCEANFDFICLPWLKRGPRPQKFMRVGCCNGKLKLVKIKDYSDDTVYLAITTFNEKSYNLCTNKWLYWEYWNTTSVNSNSLRCGDLWAAMKKMPHLQLSSYLEASGNHMPCFPVLSTYTDNILHLIMARKDNTDAWLLQVNTQSFDLEAAAAYPGFSNHQKPLYSSCFPNLVGSE